MKLEELINKLRSSRLSSKDKGDLFEKICKFLFEHDTIQHDQFSEVKWYRDFISLQKDLRDDPEFDIDRKDLGVDLMATLRSEKGFIAIQCKYRSRQKQIDKKELDSFGNEVRRLREKGIKIIGTIVVDSTSGTWTSNAKKYRDGQNRYITLDAFKTSDIDDWSGVYDNQSPRRKEKKELRCYQKNAFDDIIKGFKTKERGQLIMACGTGKTLVALRVVEEMIKSESKPQLFLFLVPSLALINQTLQEWYYNQKTAFQAIVVCSDRTVGQDYDTLADEPSYLLVKPTTDQSEIEQQLQKFHDSAKHSLTIFSTYHSLKKIVKAQKQWPMCTFRLAIADEAHNTAGIKKEDSNWTIIHDQKKINAQRRLYMTATPKVYKYEAKEKESKVFFNMNDTQKFGTCFFEYDFYTAVQNGWLSNYQLIVSCINPDDFKELRDQKWSELTEAEEKIRKIEEDKNENLDLNLLQLYRAICKDVDLQYGDSKLFEQENFPMERVLIFNPRINQSKYVESFLYPTIKHFCPEKINDFSFKVYHVDGKTPTKQRTQRINWLKNNSDYQCRMLSNARCLSEGIDIPALNAIAFLSQKSGTKNRSRIGLIQAVGRVMRKSDDTKKWQGYIIVPVVVVKKNKNEEISETNSQLTKSSYNNLISIVNDLISHDEKMRDQLKEYKISRQQKCLIEKLIIAYTPPPLNTKNQNNPQSKNGLKNNSTNLHRSIQDSILSKKENADWIKNKIFSVVAKAGDRVKNFSDFYKPLNSFQIQINYLLQQELKENIDFKKNINQFTNDLKTTINQKISQKSAMDMVLQHYLTLPVFKKLFMNHKFIAENPISQALEKIIGDCKLNLEKVRSNNHDYQEFLNWVNNKTKGLTTWQQKDEFIKDFYQEFLAIFDKKMSQKLGIVYTPNPVVNFMLKGVKQLLADHFKTDFNDRTVNILDPFAGTGTFLTHLLRSNDFIKQDQLLTKYHAGIYAKECLALPYYLLSLNLQATMKNRINSDISVCKNITLSDTFNEYEFRHGQQQFEIENKYLKINQDWVNSQISTKISVIITNPPYYRSQPKPGDINQRTPYQKLYQKWKQIISNQRGKYSMSSFYNTAFLALCYAYWRITNNNQRGIISFIIPNGFLKSRSGGGLRSWLTKAFNFIYIFDLYGDVRAAMFKKSRRAEAGENIFGSKSKTGIQILFLVVWSKKDKLSNSKAIIKYNAINNFLAGRTTTKNKLNFLDSAKFNTIFESQSVKNITLNRDYQWFYHSDHLLINRWHSKSKNYFLNLFSKNQINEPSIFKWQTNGNTTNRDEWCLNFGHQKLVDNMQKTINFYNQQIDRLIDNDPNKSYSQSRVKQFVTKDPTKIKWTDDLFKNAQKHNRSIYDSNAITPIFHRPFCLTNVYYHQFWNWSNYQTKKMFSWFMKENREQIIGVCIPQQGGELDILAVKNHLVGLHFVEAGKFYPLFIFEPDYNQTSLKWIKTSNITQHARNWIHQSDPDLTDYDVLAYLYALFHSRSYRQNFTNFLIYKPPRFCLLKNKNYLKKFILIGKRLLKLHLNYQQLSISEWYGSDYQIQGLKKDDFKLNQKGMRFKKISNDEGQKVNDLTTIIYNDQITLQNIPQQAYDYQLNGRSLIEQFINFYRFKTGEDSKITNDPNDFLNQQNDPQFFLKTLLRVINLSLKTQELINQLPSIDLNNPENLSPITNHF